MSCLLLPMGDTTQKSLSFSEDFSISYSSSTSPRRIPESSAIGSASLARNLSSDGGNHDLSPTPIDPSRMKVVDYVPVQSLQTQDETTSNMLISLLMNSLPHESHYYDSRTTLPHPSQLASAKVESSFRMNQEQPCGSINQRRSTDSMKMQSTAKRPYDNVAYAASSSVLSPSPGSEPLSQLKKTRFRALKSGQWFEKLTELAEYRKRFGHCQVPNHWKQNAALAQWVKRQRYQFKLREQGKHSTLTDERIQSLNDLGFVWSSHSAIWDERLEELQRYAAEHGNCNVPKNYPENKGLAIWVKGQRRQYKLFHRGKQGIITSDRIEKLNNIGFVWDPRKVDQKPKAVEGEATGKKNCDDDDDDDNEDEFEDKSIDSSVTTQE